MKVWYHVIAAVVGFATAALIVYLVFGNASQEGAVQDGDAGSLAAGSQLCGTIDAADLASKDSRAKAGENPPPLFDAQGPIAAISDKQPQQRAWVSRVHAAGGLCIDELRIENAAAAGAPAINDVTVAMSTTDDVDDATAAAYAGGILAQAYTPPFSPRSVLVESSVGDSQRTIFVSRRAWGAFELQRKRLGRPATVANLKLFRQATDFTPADLRITGW